WQTKHANGLDARVGCLFGIDYSGGMEVSAGGTKRYNQQSGRDAEPDGRCAMDSGERNPAIGSPSGARASSTSCWVGRGELLQWRATLDRGTGRCSADFAEQRLLQ